MRKTASLIALLSLSASPAGAPVSARQAASRGPSTTWPAWRALNASAAGLSGRLAAPRSR